MKVDLGGRLQFPQVVQTTLRPDVSHGKRAVNRPLKGRAPNTKTFCMTAGGKGGRHGCSLSRSAVEDFPLSQCGECSQPLE
ncbi:hypothetical protein FQN60_007176 [Etheostoma spectabile]|uniref:Uncharacterized protein n=1 Tax=Etheostoma spectabile TaxID=54343 RepID=A0A5J5CDN6_9PERO|nr:hypothetical protein FQN60_007176 [Etheostoma spectabile]